MRIIRSAIVFFFLLILFRSSAQKPLNVLFIGNSFTYVEDLPGTFKALAAAGGLSVTTSSVVDAGATVYGANGWANKAQTYTALHSKTWDYVVIQDNMGAYVGGQGSFAGGVVTSSIRLRDSVKQILPCSSVIWFAGWGPVGGTSSGDNTAACINRIDANIRYLNNLYPAKKEIVAPFGRAWNASMAAKPSINLYYSDNTHPGVAGQLLNASVLFTMLFKQDPSDFNYKGNVVSSADAIYLRHLGYTIVVDSSTSPLYNLGSITPVISEASGTLSVSGFASYQWYKNNVESTGDTFPDFTPSSEGSYCVIAADTNGCMHYQSFPYVIASVGVSEKIIALSRVLVYPNPVTNESVLEVSDYTNDCTLEIFNVLGQRKFAQHLIASKTYLHKKDFQPGIYFFKVTDRTGNTSVGKFKVL